MFVLNWSLIYGDPIHHSFLIVIAMNNRSEPQMQHLQIVLPSLGSSVPPLGIYRYLPTIYKILSYVPT